MTGLYVLKYLFTFVFYVYGVIEVSKPIWDWSNFSDYLIHITYFLLAHIEKSPDH